MHYCQTMRRDECSIDHRKEVIRRIEAVAYSSDIFKVFNDFLEMSAIAISNSVDFTHREEREKRYLELINSYEKRYQTLFSEMLAHLLEALEEKAQTTGPEDVLGSIFHELNLHNKYKGQFFTPQSVSDLTAFMTVGNELQSIIADKGYINICEPTCGSGVMVTGMCKEMKKNGLNYCSQLVVTAVDLDIKCVHMAFIQLSLYGIPAVVIHGNTLTLQEWSRWYTPVYLMNGWVWREQYSLSLTRAFCVEDEMIKQASNPMYAAIRRVEGMVAKCSSTENDKTHEAESTTADTKQVVSEQLQLELGFENVETLKKGSIKRQSYIAEPQTDIEQLSMF